MTRLEAFAALLSQPDAPDLPSRGCRRRLSGDPRRFRRYIPALAIAYLQHQLLEKGGLVNESTERAAKVTPFQRRRA